MDNYHTPNRNIEIVRFNQYREHLQLNITYGLRAAKSVPDRLTMIHDPLKMLHEPRTIPFDS